MSESSPHKKVLRYVSGGILAVWAVVVLVRFFQESPLSAEYIRQSLGKFRAPPLPADILKIASAVKHLLLAFLLVVVGVLTGRRALGMAGIRRSDHDADDKWVIAQDLSLALGLGWGVLIYATFLLGATRLLYAPVVWGVLLVLLLVCFRELPALFRDLKAAFSSGGSEGTTIAARAGMAALVVALLLLAVVALSPRIPHDSMVYHLNVPRIYANAHGIVAIPYNVFSNMFLNMEMLYAVALLIDSYILANLIHYVLGLATLAVLYGFARQHFGGVTATLATLMFFFNPAVLNEMPITWVDVGMTFYFVLALVCLWRWRTEGDGRWFMLLGVFAGIYAGMKYISMIGLIPLCVMIAAVQLSSGERRVAETCKRLAIFGAIVALFVAPYLIKNYLITGNPVYPALYNVFGGRWLTPEQVERMLAAHVDDIGMGHNWRNLLALPWNITMLGQKFGTTITPLWLIFLPAFLFIRPKPAALKGAVLLCAVFFLGWAASVQITRHMMPIFPLLSLLCAVTIVELRARLALVSRPLSVAFKAGAMLACGIVWLSFAWFYLARIPSEYGPVVWGAQEPDDFLAEKVPNYLVFRYINEYLPPDARLMFFFENRGFFCDKPYVADSMYKAPSMLELLHEAGSPEEFRLKLGEMGITHALFNSVFLANFPPRSLSEADGARLKDDLNMFGAFIGRYCVPLFSADGATVYALKKQTLFTTEAQEKKEEKEPLRPRITQITRMRRKDFFTTGGTGKHGEKPRTRSLLFNHGGTKKPLELRMNGWTQI